MKLYVDCDGCLTDGSLYIAAQRVTHPPSVQLVGARPQQWVTAEKPMKRFHVRDVTAIRFLRENGVEVTIVSADDWPGGAHFANKVKARFLCTQDKGSLPGPYWAVGDDYLLDAKMLERAEKAFCPADADPLIRGLPGMQVLMAPGGHGIMTEVAAGLMSLWAAGVVR